MRRTAIWKTLLNRVRQDSWSDEILQRIGTDYAVNGREIKNLIRTALALAAHTGETLAEKHIRTVYTLNRKNSLNMPVDMQEHGGGAMIKEAATETLGS